MGDSYAGVTVPDGDPGAIRSAAARLHGVAGQLQGACAQLAGLPGSISAWQGPASVSFAASCHQQAAAARSAAGAVPDAAAALTHFAHTLDDAQRDARQAIADARDAQHRIDRAEADIAEAQSAQQIAATQADAANHRLAMSSIGGVPSVDAQADLQAASDAGQAAADREAQARRRLEAARDDLERAKRRGHHAMDRARDGSQAVSGALGSGAAMPPLGMPGAPAAGIASAIPGAPSSDVWREIIKPVDPWAPRNDYERFRFWEGWAVGLPSAGAGAGMKYLSQNWMMMVPRAHIAAKILGPDGTIATREIFSIPPHAVPDEATRATWAERGKYLKRGGVALAGASGFVDQWARDSADPNMATDEKIGRATAEGVSMAGAALTGAEIGAMAGSVIPGAGTVGGAVVGAAIGIGVGLVTTTVVDKIDQPFVDLGGKVGDKVGDLVDGAGDVASGAVDSGKKVVDKIGGVFGL